MAETVALNTADAARYTAMSIAWLKLMRMTGDPKGPPFVVIGDRTIRYLKGDLDTWLRANRRAPGEVVLTEQPSPEAA